MIAFTLIKTKILEYCIESLFSKIEKNFLKEKLLLPGLYVRKIINISRRADREYFNSSKMFSEEFVLKTCGPVEFNNCIILEVSESRFMGETFKMISFYEKANPGKIYSQLEPDLEIIY